MTVLANDFSRVMAFPLPVVLLCLLAVAGDWLWFSRPVTASQQLRGYAVSGVQVIDVVMPSGGPTQLHGIATEDSEEIQELLGLLDQYPTNRKWDWSWLLGEGFGDYNGKDPYSSVWVVLSFRDADGKAEYLANTSFPKRAVCRCLNPAALATSLRESDGSGRRAQSNILRPCMRLSCRKWTARYGPPPLQRRKREAQASMR